MELIYIWSSGGRGKREEVQDDQSERGGERKHITESHEPLVNNASSSSDQQFLPRHRDHDHPLGNNVQ